MAHANNTGLNQVLELGTKSHTVVMESSKSGSSRIPKFGFGMRRTTNGDTPSPAGASPVSRSKSMKVQRTVVPKVTKHSNSIDNDEDVNDTRPSLLLTPSANYRGNPPKSQPSSRSVTPSNDNSVGTFTRSLTVTPSTKGRPNGSSTSQRVSQDSTTSPYAKTHIRSSSFGSREKYGITPPTSLKKPTHAHQSPPTTPGVKPKVSMPANTEPSRLLRRTLSNSKATPTDESDGNVESSTHKPASILRTPDSRRSSLGTPNGNGRRPNSMISFSEKSSDLNQLASEINEMGGDSHVFGSTTPRNPSTRSPRISQGVVKGGPSVSSGGGVSKLRPPIARNSSDEGNRPSSVTTNYHHESHSSSSSSSSILSTRPRSAADLHKIHSSSDHTPSAPVHSTVPSTTTRRSSTPSGGRITPQQVNIQKSIAEESDKDVRINQTGSKSVSATPRRPLGTHTKMISRTPFIRPGKPLSNRPGNDSTVTMTIGTGEDAVGLNELEGAVLLDAEDYRRMLQEVKNLKAILHRLKRELAADGGASIVTPSASVKSVARTENPDKTAELQKEIQKLTTEKNKALSDLDYSQKKSAMIENKVQSLQKELHESKQETNEVKTKYEELEGHRESLLDKVERLHADKHKLQDRLNTLEKSVKYESTVLSEEWLEDELLLADNGLDYDDEDETY